MPKALTRWSNATTARRVSDAGANNLTGSMTPKERKNPALMNAKRKKRVAAGSGTDVQTVNKVLKMHQEMGRAMKQIKKMGGLKGLGADIQRESSHTQAA